MSYALKRTHPMMAFQKYRNVLAAKPNSLTAFSLTASYYTSGNSPISSNGAAGACRQRQASSAGPSSWANS